MSDWREAKLQDAAEIEMGQSPAGYTYNTAGIGLPLINGPVEFGAKFPAAVQWTSAPSKTCRSGDILFCVRGSTTGRMNEANETYCIGRGIAAIRGRPGIALTSFLKLVLSRLANEILEEARGSGSTFPNISGSRLNEKIVLLPPTREQSSIVRVLSALDDAIEQADAVIAKHQRIKAGLIRDLFARGVTADGRLRPARVDAPQLYKESSVGSFPNAWCLTELSTLAEIVSGITLGPQGPVRDGIEVPYLRVANVQDGYFDLKEVKTITVSAAQLEKLRLRRGDVMMNEGGDFDKLGRGSVWQDQVAPCIHQNHVFRVRPYAGRLRSKYLAYWSQSELGRRYFLMSSKQSTNLASINSSQLKRFPVALPSPEEQQRIELRIDAVVEKIEACQADVHKLRLLKRGLMHDLLMGRVRVPIQSRQRKD